MLQSTIDIVWIFLTLLGVASIGGGWKSRGFLVGGVGCLALSYFIWRFVDVH